MIRPLGGDTITILKPTTAVDSRDNTTYLTFSPPSASIAVSGCMVEPFLLSEKLQFEDTRERDYARTTWRVWAPATADVLSIDRHDRLIYDGQEYEIFGYVGVWKYLSGNTRHVQFIIQLRLG